MKKSKKVIGISILVICCALLGGIALGGYFAPEKDVPKDEIALPEGFTEAPDKGGTSLIPNMAPDHSTI